MAIPYRPEIDGLRAVAVIPVILFHMGLAGVSGGFAGVDVFFVISGFLITSIILKEEGAGQFTLWGFWQRRIRRIIPALATVLLVTEVVSYFFVFSGESREFGLQGVAAGLSAANVYFWMLGTNYWAPAAEESPFLHTWSLSVEEQFYFLYPLLLVGLLRRRPGWVLPVFAVVVLGSFLAWVDGAARHPAASFFLLPFRAWELAVGGGLAVLAARRSEALGVSAGWKQGLSLAGIGMLVWAYIGLSGESNASWRLAIPVVGTGLVILFAGAETWVGRILGHRVPVGVGKISYALYLWHWPVLVLAPHLSSDPSLVVQAGVMVLASVLSYFWIEKPARRPAQRLWPIGIGFACAVLGLFGLVWSEKQYDTSMYAETVWDGQRYDVFPRHDALTGHMRRRMRGLTMVPREPGLEQAYAENGIIHSYGESLPTILVAGDSHGLMWAGVLDEIAAELNQSICHFSMAGVLPFIEHPISQTQQLHISADEKYAFDVARARVIEEWRPVVIVMARWAALRQQDCDKAEHFVRWLDGLGIEVLAIAQPPELEFGDKNAPEYLSHLGMRPMPGTVQSVGLGSVNSFWDGDRWLSSLTDAYEHCHRVEVRDFFLEGDDRVKVLDEDRVLYIDDDHLSRAGADLTKARLKERLVALLALREQAAR